MTTQYFDFSEEDALEDALRAYGGKFRIRPATTEAEQQQSVMQQEALRKEKATMDAATLNTLIGKSAEAAASGDWEAKARIDAVLAGQAPAPEPASGGIPWWGWALGIVAVGYIIFGKR